LESYTSIFLCYASSDCSQDPKTSTSAWQCKTSTIAQVNNPSILYPSVENVIFALLRHETFRDYIYLIYNLLEIPAFVLIMIWIIKYFYYMGNATNVLIARKMM
jgi:hypothetical protein